MRDWTIQARNRQARLARAASLAKGKEVAASDIGRLARSGAGAGRPRLPRGQQPEAGGFSGAGPRGARSRKGPRPAHGAIGAGAARTYRRVRTRHRLPARFFLFRPAGGAPRQTGRRQSDPDRRDPYLSRIVRALFRRSDAARQPGLRAGRRPRGQSLHRPQHRGHAGHRRGDRLQERHRHRPGQRNRRHAAARRHSRRLGRLRRAEPEAALHRAAVHPRSRRRSPKSRS